MSAYEAENATCSFAFKLPSKGTLWQKHYVVYNKLRDIPVDWSTNATKQMTC